MTRSLLAMFAFAALGLVAGCGDEGSSNNNDMDAGDGSDMPSDMPAYDAPDWWLDMTQKPPCDPVLGITPTMAQTVPLGLVTFEGAGGTGDYRFEVIDNQSGADISRGVGAYRAGPLVGSVDVVRLTDNACEGMVEATVSVVTSFDLAPSAATVRPGTTIAFEVSGGTGPFEFIVAADGSGASITTDGQYTAGSTDGVDVVEVRDTGTSQVLSATVAVSASMVFGLDPPFVAIPNGSTWVAHATGGSGHLEGTISPSNIATMSDGVITARAAGAARVDVVDRFTGDSAALTLVVSDAGGWTPVRTGDQTNAGLVVESGDIDGDGNPDAVIGVSEADVSGFNAGAVFIHRGNGAGLDDTPVRTLVGVERLDEFGYAVLVDDINSDGRLDLIVGAHGAGELLNDAGSVYVYFGEDGKFFADAPSIVLSGEFRSDHFGYAMEVCDFNGDGLQDLAVGARYAEDHTITPLVSNQGGVFLFLGTTTGLSDKASTRFFGELPQGGSYEPVRDLNLGMELASGDFDNDGLCDLAVGALSYRAATSGRSNDGAVMLFKGVADTDVRLGGVEKEPARILAGTSDNAASGHFGRYLAAGDINGDGLVDLALSHYNVNSSPNTRPGGVHILLGATLGGPAAAIEPSESTDWYVEADNGYDQFGWSVSISDTNADGVDDLIVGNMSDEVVDGTNTVGVLRVYRGQMGQTPNTTASSEFPGDTAGQRLGGSVASAGDLNGDGTTDYLSYASYDSFAGYRVGRPYWIDGASGTITGLASPGEASGSEVGRSVAVVAGSGNSAYMAVGGARSGTMELVDSGVVSIYASSGNGFSATPTQELAGFTGHSASDWFGYVVSSAGDFDGDGTDDLAVAARYDDRPGTLDPPEYNTIGTCGAARSDTGAVFIFKGNGSGFDPSPAFVHYGAQNQRIESLAGNFDFNGDGLDDIVLGGGGWDGANSNVGGYEVVYGRAAPMANSINVICAPDATFLGSAASDEFAYAMAPAGDINGDGCDDLVVGARYSDIARSNAGAAEVHFGWNSTGMPCPSARRRVVLSLDEQTSTYAGWAVAGNADFDGDGTPDIVVGIPRYRNDGATRGRAVVVRGSYIQGLPTIAATSEQVPSAWHPILDPGTGVRLQLDGSTTGEYYGDGVGFIPGAGPSGRAALAVGRPGGSVSGTLQAGGVDLHVWRNGEGVDAAPIGLISGETIGYYPAFGTAMAAGLAGGGAVFVVGAHYSSATSLDEGAAWGIGLSGLTP